MVKGGSGFEDNDFYCKHIHVRIVVDLWQTSSYALMASLEILQKVKQEQKLHSLAELIFLFQKLL